MVGMTAKAIQHFDLGINMILLAENIDNFLAINQPPAQCFRRLPTHNHDSCTPIFNVIFKMM